MSVLDTKYESTEAHESSGTVGPQATDSIADVKGGA